MKYVVLIFLVVGFFEVGFADSDCKQEDLDKLRSCYKDIYGTDLSEMMGPFILIDPIFSNDSTKEYWQPVCDKKQKLNDCIGADAIKACYNIPDIKRIPYLNQFYNDITAKYVIASFIQIDLVCDNVFKLSDADYKCYVADGPSVEEICGTENITDVSCDVINKTLNCLVDMAYKKCGNVIGCFVRKFSRLALCYDSNCNACDDISSTNNLIDGLCDDNDGSSKNVDENIVDEISSLIDLLKIVTKF